jgi:hypothetical protein
VVGFSCAELPPSLSEGLPDVERIFPLRPERMTRRLSGLNVELKLGVISMIRIIGPSRRQKAELIKADSYIPELLEAPECLPQTLAALAFGPHPN